MVNDSTDARWWRLVMRSHWHEITNLLVKNRRHYMVPWRAVIEYVVTMPNWGVIHLGLGRVMHSPCDVVTNGRETPGESAPYRSLGEGGTCSSNWSNGA